MTTMIVSPRIMLNPSTEEERETVTKLDAEWRTTLENKIAEGWIAVVINRSENPLAGTYYHTAMLHRVEDK